jgi:hypothetical protein
MLSASDYFEPILYMCSLVVLQHCKDKIKQPAAEKPLISNSLERLVPFPSTAYPKLIKVSNSL